MSFLLKEITGFDGLFAWVDIPRKIFIRVKVKNGFALKLIF